MSKYKQMTTKYFGLVAALVLLLLSSANILHAQKTNTNNVDTGKNGKDIVIIHADRKGFQKFSDTSEITYAAGNVAIRQGSTFIYCDSTTINSFSRILEAFGHVHINDNDTVNIYADYVRYESLARKATLLNNVKLNDSKNTLTTTHLDYDLNTKLANYNGNGKLINGTTVLTSVLGAYFVDTRDATFSNNVVLTDPQYNIKTDSLLYNSGTKIATFVAPTHIISGKNRTIQTSDGYYDMINKKAYFSKRPVLVDSSSTLIADEVAADDSTGFGEARGQVVYKDTAQNIVVLCGNLKSNRFQSSFLATIYPVAVIIQNTNDSTFIAADTLYSARYMDTADTVKTIRSANIFNLQSQKNRSEMKTKTIVPASTIARLDSIWHANADTARIYVRARDTLVVQTDAAGKISIASIAKSEIKTPEKKPEKKKKNILSNVFKKSNAPAPVAPPPTPPMPMPMQKDTVPTVNKNIPTNINNVDSGKQTPGIIDSLKNNPAKLKTDTLSNKTQKPADIDLSPNTDVSKKDSVQEEDKKSRFLEAYYGVRIFNDSVQAVGDSLYYDSRDSLFQLFKNPMVWTLSNNQITQISGDTIDMYTANSKPKYLRVWNNGLSISQSDTAHRASTSEYFNQMSGRTIEGWFTAGELDSIAATGNAQSVFYMMDENNKYIGVNTQTSRILDFYFVNKELNKIAGRREVVGKSYPMQQVNHEAIRLKGFQWQDDKRPKSKYELLEH